MEGCPYWHRKVDLVKSCRWFSIFDRLEFLPWWWAVALQLVRLCMRKNVVKSMSELQPRMAQNIKAAKEAAEVLHGAGQGGADGQQGGRLMKHGEADHLQFLKKMKGNLHAATCSHVQVQQSLGEDRPGCGDPSAGTPCQGTENAR